MLHLNRPFLVFYIFIGHTLAYFKLFSNCCLINCADGGNVFSQRQKREEKKIHCYRGRRVRKDNLVRGRCSFDRRERANKQRRNREENVSTLEMGDGGNQQICLCVKEREGKGEGQTFIWFGAVNWQSAGECACIVNVLLGNGEDLEQQSTATPVCQSKWFFSLFQQHSRHLKQICSSIRQIGQIINLYKLRLWWKRKQLSGVFLFYLLDSPLHRYS